MMNCIFCKIANREIPKELAYEDSAVVVFEDIKPKAPVHYLVVPRVHIPSVAHLTDGDRDTVFALIRAAQRTADARGLTGYKLMFNVGREGGQVIDHLHLHLLGGWDRGGDEGI